MNAESIRGWRLLTPRKPIGLLVKNRRVGEHLLTFSQLLCLIRVGHPCPSPLNPLEQLATKNIKYTEISNAWKEELY